MRVETGMVGAKISNSHKWEVSDGIPELEKIFARIIIIWVGLRCGSVIRGIVLGYRS